MPAASTTPRWTTSRRALQVTKPTLYYYVRSKEELLFQCFLAGLEGIEAGLAQALQSHASGRDRLQQVLRRYAVAIASEFGWCMVRAEDQDLAAELSAQIRVSKGAHRPGYPDPDPRRHRGRFRRGMRPEDDRVRPRRRAELDRPLASAGRRARAGGDRRPVRRVLRERPAAPTGRTPGASADSATQAVRGPATEPTTFRSFQS